MKPIVIIGAGLTGLAAGYALRRAGREVVILEREDSVGGLARSVSWEGCVFDLGPHYFFLKFDERVDRLVMECLEGRARVFDFQVSALIRGRNLAWPPDLHALFRLPFSSTLTTAKNAIKRRFPPDKDCRGFMRAFYGRAVYDAFLGPYLEKKVPSIPPDELHRDWWLQVARDIHNRHRGGDADPVKRIEERRRVPLGVRAKVFLKLAAGLVNTARGKNLRKVLYPEGGMGSLAGALAARFREAGGRLHLGVEDVRRRARAGGGRIMSVTGAGEEYPDPERVIWTGSVHALAEQLALPKAELPFLDITLGFVRTRRRLELPPFLYTYYALPEVPFNRAYFPSLILDGLVPKGGDGVCVEISGGEGAASGEAVVAGLERVGICRAGDVEAVELRPVPEAYPLYPLDYYPVIRALWDRFAEVENLWSVGRSGQFYYNNMARSMALALDLAEHLLAQG